LKISIIIVNYNTSDYLENCINSVNKFEKNFDIEFIVVDNNSDEKKILNELQEKYGNVNIIFLDSNKGFAYANNRGFEACSGEYVLILNPDIEFTESVIEKLIANIKETNAGAVGVKLYGEDGKLQKKYYQKYPNFFQYFFFYSIFAKPFLNSVKPKDKYLENKIEENNTRLQKVLQIPGAFIFLKKDIYKEVKGFDESYFLFFEDVDLCYRIGKKYDLYIANANVKHTGASSMMLETNYKIYGYFIVSFVNFYRKNYNLFSFWLLKFFVFTNSVSKIILENIRRIINRCQPNIIKVHNYILKNF
jgi:GT2 family glycosyltransferase